MKDIVLSGGWKLTFETVDRDGEDFIQGFVIGPRGHGSASLTCALATGATSDTDEPIPEKVLKELEKYEEYQ